MCDPCLIDHIPAPHFLTALIPQRHSSSLPVHLSSHGGNRIFYYGAAQRPSFRLDLRALDHIVRGKKAAKCLFSLHQGSRSIADFAVEFWVLAAYARWNDEALQTVIQKGISNQIKDELAAQDKPKGLNALISLTIELDKCIIGSIIGKDKGTPCSQLPSTSDRFQPPLVHHLPLLSLCCEALLFPSRQTPLMRSPCSWVEPASHPLNVPRGLGRDSSCTVDSLVTSSLLVPSGQKGSLPVAIGTLMSPIPGSISPQPHLQLPAMLSLNLNESLTSLIPGPRAISWTRDPPNRLALSCCPSPPHCRLAPFWPS